jgi:hypothetical protein
MNKYKFLIIAILIFHKVEAAHMPSNLEALRTTYSKKIDSLVLAINTNLDNTNLDITSKEITSQKEKPTLIFYTKKSVGIKSNWSRAGLEYTNSKNTKLIYSKPLNISSGISYYIRKRFALFEFGASYSQVSSTFKSTGLISTIALNQANLECIPSLLLFSGPIRAKIGSGLSYSYVVKGTQYNNGLEYDLLKSTFKRHYVSSISEVGLVFIPKRYLLIQVVGFYSVGLTNIEKNEHQTSKINGYGISTGLSFVL